MSGAVLALVTVTAWALALRAGRRRTVDALVVGRTPSTGRGRLARRLANRLPLPRPVVIGLANPFTRPGRSTAMAAAVLLGAVSVAFAAGLATSLSDVQTALRRDQSGDVTVTLNAGPNTPTQESGTKAGPASPAQVAADIATQPGIADYWGITQSQAGVAGVTGGVTVVGYIGDAAAPAYQMISGSWFTTPGQAVVPTRFLTTTGDRIGDTVTLTQDGHQVTLRITGEALDTHNDGMQVLTDLSSLDALQQNVEPQQFSIRLTAGSNLAGYVNALNAKFASTTRARGTHKGARALTCYRQALMVLVWFRKGEDKTLLGAGFAVLPATAYRYVAITILSARAPDLHAALQRVADEGCPT